MNRRFWMKWLVLPVLTLAAIPAMATEAPVSADSYVNRVFPAVNFGYQSNLRVSNMSTSLLGFNLASLPSGTTSSQVSKATLWLYINRVDTAGSVNVSPVTSTWSESAVTYNSIPSLGSVIASFTAASGEQYIAVDLTALVQSWLTTPSSNFGIALSSSTANIVLDSRKNDETSHSAWIDIVLVNQGAQGVAGQAATVSVGTVSTGAPGSTATVTNSGTTSAAVLNFLIPQGPTGATGTQGPAGAAATVTLGTTTTGAAGTSASVTNSGSSSAAVFNFTIPRGATGAQGPPVTFLNAYNPATSYIVGNAVSEAGSSYIAVNPSSGEDPATDVAGAGQYWALLAAKGGIGNTGNTGAAATISIGSVSTGTPGSNAQVTNAGTSGAAIFNFTIPQGATGAKGDTGNTGNTGPQGPPVNFLGAYNALTPYVSGDAVAESGSSYIAILASTGHDPVTDVGAGTTGTYWSLLAAHGTAGSPGATGSGFSNGTAAGQVYLTGTSASSYAPEAPVSLSGDLTIDYTGATSIGSGKVTTAKIASGAVAPANLHVADASTPSGSVFYRGDGSWASISGSNIGSATIGLSNLSATGTAGSTNFLRGDNSWAQITGATIASGTIGLSNLSATGTAGATNFLRGDNSWAQITGATIASGTVTGSNLASGTVTPANLHVADSSTPSGSVFYRGDGSWASISGSNIGSATIGLSNLSATGTAGATNFLRGDNSWAQITGAAIASDTVTPSNLHVVDSSTPSGSVFYRGDGSWATPSGSSGFTMNMATANNSSAGDYYIVPIGYGASSGTSPGYNGAYVPSSCTSATLNVIGLFQSGGSGSTTEDDTFTLRHFNGSSWSNTSVSCTIHNNTGASTAQYAKASCNSGAVTVSFAAGDLLEYLFVQDPSYNGTAWITYSVFLSCQ